MNTYGYALGNPVNYTDPDGQLVQAALPAAVANCLLNPLCVLSGTALVYCSINLQKCADFAANVGRAIGDAICPPIDPNQRASRGNVADTQIVQSYGVDASNARLSGGQPPEKCAWLKANAHRFTAAQVKATEKAWGCRRSRNR